MIVEILGTPYTVKEDKSLNNTGADGLCKCYSKEILYRNPNDMLEIDDPPEIKQARWSEVLRHEIVHAFFHEAGLDQYSNDEVLVDWIAKQFPKIVTAIVKAGG